MNMCDRSCREEDPFDKMFAPSKIEDANLKVFNMIEEINESRPLAKHISCKCRREFDGSKCNLRQKCNNNKC